MNAPGSPHWLAVLAAAATGVQVGVAIVASRYVIHDVPPFTLALLRYFVGALCLLPFALVSARQHADTLWRTPAGPRWRDWLVVATLGVGQFGGLIALLNLGLQHISAANGALIFSLMPVLTLVLAAWFGAERFNAALALGVLLCIGGVALALGPKLSAPLGQVWWGELAVLGSAMLGALCSVLYRPYLRRYPTVLVSFIAMLGSVLALMLLAWPEDWPRQALSMKGSTWSVVLFIGVLSGVGYGWWLYALKHLPPTRVTVFLSLSPLTAAVLGQWLLGEPSGPTVLGGVALAGLGLWLSTRGDARAPG